MTVTVRVVEGGVVRIEWPGRMTAEIKDALFWVLDGVDGVDGIWHGNYTTELQTASHLVDPRLTALLVSNLLLDDEHVADFLAAQGWGDLEVCTAP